MAKAKRANHRNGTERPRWTLNGTVEEPRADEVDWNPDEAGGRPVPGSNGHAGRPVGEPGQNGVPKQNGQAGHNGTAGQNGGVNGQTMSAPTQNAPSQNALSKNAAGQNPAGQNPAGQSAAGQKAVGQNAAGQGAAGQSVPPVSVARADRAGFGMPVRVDEIALAAMALSENLEAATRGLPESIESRRFRRDLDDAAGTFRSVASELETTAGNLIRLAANEGQTCGVTWGICPDHGLTLMNVGEAVTCHVLGCHRENEGVAERCTKPVAYRVVDAAGPSLLTCAGHAIACRLHLEGAVITLASDSLEVL